MTKPDAEQIVNGPTNRFAAHATRSPKAFSWSYSRLKNFETCAFRHQQIDVDKTIAEPESDELRTGNEAHDTLAAALGRGVALPARWAKYQAWVDRLTSKGNDVIYVEQQLAIMEDKSACEWFGKGAWFRAKVDYLKLVDTEQATIALAVDWKTGKRVEDSVQLALTAACVFAHYPQVRKIRTEFVWLKEGVSLENTTREDFTPADMDDLWAALEPRIDALRYAFDTKSYPTNPGRLCRRYCPVSSCEYHGRSF